MYAVVKTNDAIEGLARRVGSLFTGPAGDGALSDLKKARRPAMLGPH